MAPREKETGIDTERAIAQLLGLAGERAHPRPESYGRARTLAMAAWRRTVDEERRVRRAGRKNRLVWFAAAASIAAVIAAAIVAVVAPDASRPLDARVERATGTVVLLRRDGQSRSVTTGESLEPGTLVTDDRGRIAIRLTGGHSLRLDQATRVRFEQDGGVALLHGAIYFDSGSAHSPPTSFRLATPVGVVQHLGTQYQVTVAETLTSVSVREGQIRLVPVERDRSTGQPPLLQRPLLVGAGEELRVSTTGQLERRVASAHGAHWAWAAAIAPAFDIENRSAGDFLSWIVREQGWVLRFASDEAREAAHRTVLHGSISGLAPGQALRRVSAITDLSFGVADGVLTVDTTASGGE